MSLEWVCMFYTNKEVMPETNTAKGIMLYSCTERPSNFLLTKPIVLACGNLFTMHLWELCSWERFPCARAESQPSPQHGWQVLTLRAKPDMVLCIYLQQLINSYQSPKCGYLHSQVTAPIITQMNDSSVPLGRELLQCFTVSVVPDSKLSYKSQWKKSTKSVSNIAHYF